MSLTNRSAFSKENDEIRTIDRVIRAVQTGDIGIVDGNAITWTRTSNSWQGDVTKAAAVTDETDSTATGTASTVSVTSTNAGDSYTTAERDLINELKGDLNQLVTDFNALVTAHNNLITDYNGIVDTVNALLANLRTAELLTT